MTKKHLFLIDAYGFLFRAYHSMPPLTRGDGTPVGAVLGYTNMLLKRLNDMHALDRDNDKTSYYAAVILDAGQKTFRNEIYDQYKANRPPAPDDLIPQFPLVREASIAMNLPTIERVGYEADDLIATYARLADKAGMKVTIVSSDKDLMQLVGENIAMYDASKDRRIEPEQVEEKFGVPPEKVLDVLSLMGDASDNVPGVPGIGPKTASELINTYGNLDTLLERASEIKQNKRRESLIEFADQARLSRDLITLCEDVPIEVPLEELQIKKTDTEKLLSFLREQNFKALVSRYEKQLGLPPAAASSQEPTRRQAAKQEDVKENYKLVDDENKLSEWLKGVVGKLAIWIEQEKDEIIGIALAHSIGNACYIPVSSKNAAQQGLLDLLSEANDNEENGIAKDVTISHLQKIIAKDSTLKIGHDLKGLTRNLEILPPIPLDDIQIMSYILDGSKTKHEIASIAEQELNVNLLIPEDILPKKTSLKEIEPEKISPFIARKADSVLRLHNIFKQRLFDEKLLTVYEKIERPLIPVLNKMEKEGIKVDPVVLGAMSDDFAQQINILEKQIFAAAGEEFNIGSPKQMGIVLFENMGIQGGKVSKKSGAYSTGADILEELSVQGHVIADDILKWRQISKLKSTYTDALPKEIKNQTGRIHTNYGMTVTSTGRLSSISPNLQNIPIRTEEGKKIRTAFIAEKGKKLISADYSQIELRLLASVANIKELKQAFADGVDVHALTASQVFGVPLEQVDSKLRYNAKAINFGIIYGQSAFGLAAGLGISRPEAKDYITAYFKQYPGILEYMETTKEFAREHGYVKTIYGRKCFTPGIATKGPMRAFAERAAINAPLQGAAADIIKLAMIKLDNALPEDSKMLLQIHDELIVETPEEKAEEIAKLLINTMESANLSDVPLTVEANIGNNWGEIH